MISEDVELAIKVLIVGSGGVGKSSLIRRFCKGQFNENYRKTIGVDFLESEFKLNLPEPKNKQHHNQQSPASYDIRMMCWDTAGQEDFNAISKTYYRGAQAAILSFSTVDRGSFQAVRKWRQLVLDETAKNSGKDNGNDNGEADYLDTIPMLLMQTKVDLIRDPNAISPKEAEDLAKELNLKLFRVSAKENFNVKEVFETVATMVINRNQRAQSSALNNAREAEDLKEGRRDDPGNGDDKDTTHDDDDREESGDGEERRRKSTSDKKKKRKKKKEDCIIQ